MPIHLPTVSRRGFLAGSVGAAAGLLSLRSLAGAAADVDANAFALLADTHVDADPATVARGVNMNDHCRRAVRQVLALDRRPGAVMINGDAAYLDGRAGDYEQLDRCLRPLFEADIPVHITMGNHDDRGPFYGVMQRMRPESPPLAGWHVDVLETEHANWFLVDSLDQVNVTPGRLGERQRAWLDEALAALPDKPALVVGHHYPEDGNGNGLQDSDAMFDIFARHEHVKAYVFGHSHRWHNAERDGVRLINLPAVAYVFNDRETSGWVLGRTSRDGLELEYQALDGEHRYHGQRVEVTF